MKPFSKVLFVFLLAIVPLFAAVDPASSDIAAHKAVAFSAVTSASVARLDGSERLGISRFLTRKFHRYRLISHWEKLDAAASQTLAALLKEQIDAAAVVAARGGLVLSSFCVPRPGFAVRLETERGTRDFLICLECGDIAVFGDDRHGVNISFGADVESKLKAIYQAHFAEEKKPNKSPQTTRAFGPRV